jgi:hypothetical protein
MKPQEDKLKQRNACLPINITSPKIKNIHFQKNISPPFFYKKKVTQGRKIFLN